MKTIKIKAPLWFIKLYDESVKLYGQVWKEISKEIGYAEFWAKQNFPKCLEMIKDQKKKDKIDKLIYKASCARDYSQAKFRYTYASKIPVGKVIPRIEYKIKKKEIHIKLTKNNILNYKLY